MKLAVIPARGGSKRIPKKNIKDFLGKPIIAYSIENALKSELFDEVMVSTDDQEIAEVARCYGAQVPFMRSKETSDDFATTYDVIEEVLLQYRDVGFYPNQVCCLYPCSPLTSIESLHRAYQLLSCFDSVFPIVKFSYPTQRALKLRQNNSVSFFYPEHSTSRSQDLESSYHDAGQFYWLNIGKILQQKKLITTNSGSIVISELAAQDIDNEVDWQMAILKYNILLNNTNKVK